MPTHLAAASKRPFLSPTAAANLCLPRPDETNGFVSTASDASSPPPSAIGRLPSPRLWFATTGSCHACLRCLVRVLALAVYAVSSALCLVTLRFCCLVLPASRAPSRPFTLSRLSVESHPSPRIATVRASQRVLRHGFVSIPCVVDIRSNRCWPGYIRQADVMMGGRLYHLNCVGYLTRHGIHIHTVQSMACT